MGRKTLARCPDCGREVASGPVISGLCPHCLLSLALVDSEAEELPTIAGVGAPEAGEILGKRYQIRSVLGRGGQGEVFRAFDLKLRVDVALKTVRPELVRNEQALALLRSEVRLAREVVSPHVCRVFDLVVEDGRELVSMEYIDGTTLSEILKSRGPLELSEAREIAAQFLSGLEAIHEAGLVHRDLKPENIMLTRSGRVVVMDFGIAKALAREKKADTIAGTPGYMAPEQARGQSVDARADVFSAGVVLAEMTSGAKSRDDREELWRCLRESPPRTPETPWSPVLLRALAWDRNARYASARDLARALEEVTLRLPGFEKKSPYPGLASFTEKDAEFFFGREVDIEAVWKKLRRPGLLGLIAPSGAGKTSFLRAGLLTALPEDWGQVLVTLGSRPFRALARALVPYFSGENEATELLLGFEDPGTAVGLVRRWRERYLQAVVVIDPFEELFTLNPAEVQRSFAELLGRLTLEADVHVLLSMRDDFLFHCRSHEALAPIFSELTALGTLSESAMRRMLIQPALACGYRFEDERLVDEMVSEVKSERGALPLLAFAASKLWERRDRQQGLLTREAYEHIGGVGGSLAQHAETTLENIGRELIPIVRELFRNLVTAHGTRAARDREELLDLFEGDLRDRASEVLDSLVDARLLTSYEMPGREAETHRIEIIHESLLSAWPRLVHWQTQDAEGARLRDELRQAAQMWEQRNRSDDVLWTGSAFQEFQLWKDRYPGSLTPLEEAFGQAMAARAARRKRNRRVSVISAFAMLLAVVAAVGTLWRQAVSQALRAEASKLVALGQLELETYPTAAVAYALKSLERADTVEGRLFALQSLQRAPPAMILTPPSKAWGEARALAFSPDGNWLAVGGMNKAVLWSRDGGAPIALGEYPTTGAVQVGFGPQSDLLVTVLEGELRFWSVPGGTELRRKKLDGPSQLFVRGRGFFTLTRVGEEQVIRSWLFDGEEPRLVGRMERLPVEIDREGRFLVYRSGHRTYLRSLRDWSRSPRLVAEHSRDLRWIEVRPGGEQIAFIDDSNAILVGSLASGSLKPLRQLPGQALNDLRFDTSGTRLVSGGLPDGLPTHRLWDLTGPPDAEPAVLQRAVTNTQESCFDPSGQWLATAYWNDVAFWPIADGYPRVLAHHSSAAYDVVFTPDGRWILTAFSGGTRAWPVSGERGEQSRRLLGGARGRHDIDQAGENVLVSDGKTVYLVPLNGEPPTKLGDVSPSARDLSAVAFGPDGRVAAAAVRSGPAGEKIVRVWDLETGESRVLGPLEGAGAGYAGGVEDLQFLGENRFLAAGFGGLHVGNLEEGTVEPLLRDERFVYPRMAVSHDGDFLLLSRMLPTSLGGELIRFDFEGQKLKALESHGTRVFSVALDPTSTLIATGDTAGVVRVGPITGEEPHLLYGHEGFVNDIAFSPDGRFLASVGQDGTLRLWRVPEGPPFHTLPYEEILRRLRSVTNVRVEEDETSSTGYSLGMDPFPGWETVPRWSGPIDEN